MTTTGAAPVPAPPSVNSRAADAADPEDTAPMNSATTTDPNTDSYSSRGDAVLAYVSSLEAEFGPGAEFGGTRYPYWDRDYCDPLTDDPDRARGWRYTLFQRHLTIRALHNSADSARLHVDRWTRWAATLAGHVMPWAGSGTDIDELLTGRVRNAVVVPTVVDLNAVRVSLVQAVAAADAIVGAYQRHAIALDAVADRLIDDLAALYITGPFDTPHDDLADDPFEDPTDAEAAYAAYEAALDEHERQADEAALYERVASTIRGW